MKRDKFNDLIQGHAGCFFFYMKVLMFLIIYFSIFYNVLKIKTNEAIQKPLHHPLKIYLFELGISSVHFKVVLVEM